MRYVYDSYGIGLAKRGEKSYRHRAAPRPGGVPHLTWVKHAEIVCKVLNKEN